MTIGKSIKLYLVNGNPSGVICSYLSNWNGQAIKIPRNKLADVKKRDEVNNIGVYLLFGYSNENPEELKIYIGEADNLYKRLAQHAKSDEKDFWNEAIAFSSKDDNLTKGHIKYLEYRLINILGKNKNYDLINNLNPSKPKLSEMDEDEMEMFLDNMKILIPVLGYKLFVSKNKSKAKKSFYKLKISGIKAKGDRTDNGFIVYKNSQIKDSIANSLSEGYKAIRKMLIEKNIIDEDKKIFIEDYEFSSPSAAAAIIMGYPMNGRTAWKDENEKTLKQNEIEELE